MIVYAPHIYPQHPIQPLLFLAGSIEMGTAQPWQAQAAERLDSFFTVLNPRRPDWDSSWTQTKDNPQFREQVEWELTGLERSDYILFYFDPATKSPITLMELGAFGSGGTNVVVCPEGFWRKGNVDIICERYDVPMKSTLEEAIDYLIQESL